MKSSVNKTVYIYVGELNKNLGNVGLIKEENFITELKNNFPLVEVVACGTPQIKNRLYFILKDLIVLPFKLMLMATKYSRYQKLIIANAPFLTTMLPAVTISKFFKLKLIANLDQGPLIPHYPKLINQIQLWLYQQADGIITYTANSVLDFAPNKPFVEVFYPVNEKTMAVYQRHQPLKNKTFTIAYTGALNHIYHLDTIIKIIVKTKSKYHWVFAGVGEYAEEIKQLATDQRYQVEYLGEISNQEAAKVQISSDLLLALKGRGGGGIDRDYQRYAASGKLMEYLCSAVPILASDISAFSPQIKPFMTNILELTPEKIISAIENIQRDYYDKKKQAKSGQKFAFQNFTVDHQGEKVAQFLQQQWQRDFRSLE